MVDEGYVLQLHRRAATCSTLTQSKAWIHRTHLPHAKLFLLAARSVLDALLLHVLLQFVFPSLLLRLFRCLFRLWTGEPIAGSGNPHREYTGGMQGLSWSV